MRVEIEHKPAHRALAGRSRYGALGAARLGARRRGFTLIEMMIALSVFLLLMVVVFVPLTQAVSTFNAGRADIELQQTAQQTMNQIEAELQKAVYVFPNDTLPGVSDVKPYYLDTSCTGTRVSNPGRLDFITGDTNPVLSIAAPTPTPLPGPTPAAPTPTPIPGTPRMNVPPATFVTTFYPRRIDTAQIYAPYDNEFTLIRAQIPYQYADGKYYDGGNYPPYSSSKVDTSPGRNGPSSCGSGSEWLVQGRGAAPDTEPDLTGPTADAVAVSPPNVDPEGYATTHGSNNIMLPREISNPTSAGTMEPETTFICEDTNGDGKIDRVTVNLALQQFETATSGGTNGKPRRHVVRLSQTIDLPNIR